MHTPTQTGLDSADLLLASPLALSPAAEPASDSEPSSAHLLSWFKLGTANNSTPTGDPDAQSPPGVSLPVHSRHHPADSAPPTLASPNRPVPPLHPAVTISNSAASAQWRATGGSDQASPSTLPPIPAGPAKLQVASGNTPVRRQSNTSLIRNLNGTSVNCLQSLPAQTGIFRGHRGDHDSQACVSEHSTLHRDFAQTAVVSDRGLGTMFQVGASVGVAGNGNAAATGHTQRTHFRARTFSNLSDVVEKPHKHKSIPVEALRHALSESKQSLKSLPYLLSLIPVSYEHV